MSSAKSESSDYVEVDPTESQTVKDFLKKQKPKVEEQARRKIMYKRVKPLTRQEVVDDLFT